jgi:hypothetical protein
MTKGDEFRANAVDCMRLAGAVGDSVTRMVLVQMADAWLRLADHVDLGKLYAPRELDSNGGASGEIVTGKPGSDC